MTKRPTPTDPFHRLTLFVLDHPSQRVAAKALGISAPYLSDLLHKRRAVSDRLLLKLGLRRAAEQFFDITTGGR